MTPEQFVYWLNGALEIMDPKQLDEKQIQVIKDHISLVLKKETPNRKEPNPINLPVIVDPSIVDWKITTSDKITLQKSCGCLEGTFCSCQLKRNLPIVC